MIDVTDRVEHLLGLGKYESGPEYDPWGIAKAWCVTKGYGTKRSLSRSDIAMLIAVQVRRWPEEPNVSRVHQTLNDLQCEWLERMTPDS